MSDPYHQPPPEPAHAEAPPARTPEEQLAHEAAIGRAVMMVQRMEEDARERIRLQSEAEMAKAHHEAAALVDEARRRADQVAEITRSSVARVLAEEHAELLGGLAELNAVEQRLRAIVTRTQSRLSGALGGSVSPGTAGADAPVGPPAAAPAVPPVPVVDAEPASPAPPAAPPSMPPVPVTPPAAGAAAVPELDIAQPPRGTDDAYLADLRSAIDGDSTIAGRVPAGAAAGAVAPPPPTPQSSAPAPFAAAATAALAAVATEPVADPAEAPAPSVPTVPTLRVVPSPAVEPDLRESEPWLSVVEPADTTAVMPEAGRRRSRESARRSRWAKAGTVLRNLGVLLLLFVAFQLWGTAALEHRDQSRLRHDFKIALASQTPASGSTATPTGDGSTLTPPTTAVPAPPAAPSGEAVAMIKIPKIGVEQAVVEGTGVTDLRKGPGHYRNTPLPGQPGNAAIAGHRTTYGAPFNRLDELAVGDPILVTTLQGHFKYIVSDAPFPVSPSQNDVLFNKGDNRLTLTTCHPKFSASKRLIVVAKLAKDAKPAPVRKDAPKTPRAVADDAGTSGDAGALLPALAWAALVGAAYAGMVRLSRRWNRRAALLLGTPIVLALLFPFFEQLSRLLPANY
ncbi:MAG: sortase [Acidimicrobiia bacterium]